jgi:Flp pilus assembly protein TadG
VVLQHGVARLVRRARGRPTAGALARPSVSRSRVVPHLEPSRGRRGQALVELAIVLPVMLIIVGAAIDLGRLFQAHVAIENGAREGAFFGARYPRCDVVKTGCDEPGTVDWHVRNELPGLAVTAPVITCLDAVTGAAKNVNDCVEDDTYQVSVGHQFTLLTPLLAPILGNQLSLGSTSTSVVLNAAFDPDATPIPIPSGSAAPSASTGPSAAPSSPPAGCTTAPAANFTFSQLNKNRPVVFQDASTAVAGCAITAWSWSFGDGSPAGTAQHPTHAYPTQATPYNVTLTVTNGAGLSNGITIVVTTK